MVFGIDAVDFADIALGYASLNYGLGDSLESKGTDLFLNVSKADGDWSANLLYLKQTSTDMGTEMADFTAMGIDFSYGLMGGDLSLDVSYNTNATDGYDDDQDMLSLGATYNVNESMSITANQTTYGENGFSMDGTNMDGSWLQTGGMGYLSADDQNRNIGVTYSMGAFNLGAAMHQITNTGDDAATEDAVADEDYSRDVMEVSLGYTLNDNANLSVKYASDTQNDDDADKYMWVTLNIRP
jgi:hypothetical protein